MDWKLARRNHVTLPALTLDAWQSMYSFRDFDHFIEIYLLAAGCIQTPDDFVLMTERFLERQAQHNVRYCEAFISASLIQDKFPPDEVIAALAEGIRRGEGAHGVKLCFIPDITNEYVLLARQGFSWAELWQLNLNALEASFLPDEAKASYRAEWQTFEA